ncbi:hypothetical protein Ait01nite_024040 [Actinoplanes italicus]|uniref:Lipoprotein n=1 Tax=Actinoplanes italicus TaxID=113567 RepID=A0A2T0KFS1_9ACTN|nr:hypothetical protein [Actinoplanes italicus]PRX22220.1 hypothetical protein CLV67_105397 [Actinoplanes italicus]GIE29359.1 hypothetical protein Ait01nite_024040 [Actinoplanes italicus]
MPRYRAALLLATLLLSGCTADDRSPAGNAASAGTTTSAAAESATTTPATAAPFPYTVSRRGGFAGVDDRAQVSADGTAVVTTGNGSAAAKALPVATMDELRGLLTSPGFTSPATVASAPTCADGFEYEMVTPAAALTVHDCGDSHGPTVDRLIAISADLFKA